jgi:hypothetical protein
LKRVFLLDVIDCYAYAPPFESRRDVEQIAETSGPRAVRCYPPWMDDLDECSSEQRLAWIWRSRRLLPALGLLAVALLAGGCATAPRRPPQLSCVGPARAPPLTPVHVVEGPVGRLEVAVLEPRLAAPSQTSSGREPPGSPGPLPWLLSQPMRVVADGATLQSLAAAISRELRVNVELEPEVAPVRVFVHLPETTLRDFLSALNRSVAVAAFEEAVEGLVLERRESWERRVEARTQYEPVMLHVLSPRTGRVPAADFAALFCRELATHRGSAATLGDQLLLKDIPPSLNRAENLWRELEGLESQEGSAPPR